MDKNFFIKNKKKITIVVIAVAVLLIGFSLLNSTYSLFYHEDVASNSDNYSTGLLSITATGKGDSISLTNTLPMSDTEGAATAAYTFTIKNIGNLDYKFNVKLLSTGDSSTTIDSQYIKIKVDNGSVTTLSSLSNSIIKSNITLSAGQSIDISIRVWLSSNTPNTQIGKIFNSKIVTDGEAVYTSTNKSVYDYWTGAAKTIADLYTNSTKTPVINNNITYQYDTTNNLMADVDGNIRYYGASPNNYIYFNCSDYSNQSSDTCETWRIIGVFDGKVKLVRNSSIGIYSIDNSGTGTTTKGSSDWTISRLMKLLNDGYENESIGGSLYWNRTSGNCYLGTDTDANVKCDMSSVGLKNNNTKSMINKNVWYLRAGTTMNYYPDDYYKIERISGGVYASNPVRELTWSGYIGLIYASDYGYAADLNKCSELTIENYNSSTNQECKNSDWLYTGDYKWTLATMSNYSDVMYRIATDGGVRVAQCSSYGTHVYPTLYLNTEINIIGGTGTSSDPYQLTVE